MSKTPYKKGITLQKQFMIRMFFILLIVLLVSGCFQYYYLNHVVSNNVNSEALSIASNIEQGIKQSDASSTTVEHQLDLKLKLIAIDISKDLGNQTVNEITNSELKQLSKEYGIAGVSIFAPNNGDVVGMKSTNPSDIGFSFKKMFGPKDSGFLGMTDLLNNRQPIQQDVSYVDHNTIILYTSQSGSTKGKPVFYKYAYYHNKSQNYIIDPFMEANEVYQLTQSVGPDSLIKTVLDSNKYAEEIAVLDPRVFADPSLAKKMYPPLQKVVYGSFKTSDSKDNATVVALAKHVKQVSYISRDNGRSYFKMFIPIKGGKVIYVALNYNLMSSPLHDMSLILIMFSLMSLVALFLLTAKFFSSIYRNIQSIITQIKQMEVGDFTARSVVTDKGELADLSASANHMVETLSNVLKDTTRQAEKVQNHALILKTDTDEYVEKVYSISIDLTSKARDDNFEITEFLDMLEGNGSLVGTPEIKKELASRIETIRKLSDSRSESTTDITLTLSDLIKSLQDQSVELSNISNTLFNNMYKFKLK